MRLTLAEIFPVTMPVLAVSSSKLLGMLPFTMPQSEIEDLLADHYTIVRQVRQIPPVLKEAFSNVTGLPFDMNNPGDPMSTDAIIHAPSRQLIFAAVGKQSAILVYEQGSFASFPCAVVFSRTGAAAWIAIHDHRPKDVAALRRSVHQALFSPMNLTKIFTFRAATPGTPRSSILPAPWPLFSARPFRPLFLRP